MSTNPWTPRDLPGGVYCSPRCGCKCTRADFDRATAEAAAMAERMGSGWTPRVWENGGWHWHAVKGERTNHGGLAEIHPHVDGRYSAWINPMTEGVAQVITESFSDPVEALGIALQQARTVILRFSGELDSISNEGS